MSLKETLRTESQKEREKLKNMSTDDKIWYIWEYYKIHILIALGILLIIYLIISMIYRSTFDTRLSYTIVNNRNTETTNLEPFDQKFKTYMNFGKKDLISSEASLYISYSDRPSEAEYAASAKISALVASKDLDIMITDQLNIDHYMNFDAFVNLEEFLPDELWQSIKDSVYYATDSEGRQVPCAFDLNSTSFPEETGVSITPCYAGVIVSSVRTDTVVSWFRFLLENR